MRSSGASTIEESRCARCTRCCRVGTTFLFSHVGLCALVVGYTLVGALAFQHLEARHEEAKRVELQAERSAVLHRIWQLTTESDLLLETNWSTAVIRRLQEFELRLVKAVRKEGWDGSEPGQPLQWSFSGSIFFSIIVITTIGYGNIAPKTQWGKVITILYALVGIPLLLLCLSNIGDIMAHSFRFLYWKVCCFLCVKPRRRRHHRRSHYPPPTYEVRPVNGGADDGVIPNKYVLQSNKDLLSLPPSTEWRREETPDSEEDSESEDEVAVPIWLCLAIVAMYICGGAIIFTLWEKWEFLDSAYFCFVTLTTIGFGDLVPGQAVLADEARVALGLCSLYLLFGMALLAMSFNLVQEEVTRSVKDLGRRIGILPDEDDY